MRKSGVSFLRNIKKSKDAMQDLIYVTNIINEQKMLRRILSDISEFMEFFRDCKGLSLSEHIKISFQK